MKRKPLRNWIEHKFTYFFAIFLYGDVIVDVYLVVQMHWIHLNEHWTFYFNRTCIFMCRWIDIVSIRQFLSFRFDNLWTIREHQEGNPICRNWTQWSSNCIFFFSIRQQFSIQHACGFCQWLKLIYELQKKVRKSFSIWKDGTWLTWISSFFFLCHILNMTNERMTSCGKSGSCSLSEINLRFLIQEYP